MGALLILLITFIIPGCGGKVSLSDDSVRIRKISDFVNGVKKLCEQRDDHIFSMFSPEYLETSKELREAIQKDIEKFNNIALNILIDRIEINDGIGNISMHWNGSWKDDKKTYREGGSLVLIISYGESVRITGIKGDSPFGISRILHDN